MDKSRQQFEEWFNENGISTGWCSKRELEFIKNKMYLCWQASRESLNVELPSGKREVYQNYYDHSAEGFNNGVEKCKTILISNGVKIKND